MHIDCVESVARGLNKNDLFNISLTHENNGTFKFCRTVNLFKNFHFSTKYYNWLSVFEAVIEKIRLRQNFSKK